MSSFFQLDTDISDATKWENLFSYSYQAENTPSIWKNRIALPHTPIPETTIPIIFSTHIIIVEATITDKPDWKRAGWIKQYLRTGLSGVSNYDSLIVTKPISFGEKNIIIFPIVGNDYKLKYNFPYWINNISIDIFGYSLEIESKELKQLESASSQLIQIEATLETINAKLP
jgi:hypothetical protein